MWDLVFDFAHSLVVGFIAYPIFSCLNQRINKCWIYKKVNKIFDQTRMVVLKIVWKYFLVI